MFLHVMSKARKWHLKKQEIKLIWLKCRNERLQLYRRVVISNNCLSALFRIIVNFTSKSRLYNLMGLRKRSDSQWVP